MTLTTAQSVYVLASLAVAAGLWAAHISVSSATRGAEWAAGKLPGEIRWGLIALAAGVVAAIVVEPLWLGLGVVYLAGVVVWTARAVLRGLQRLAEAGAYEPLPVDRQAVVVGRAGLWLLTVSALGVAVTVIDYESRGGVAFWDLLLVAAVVVVGVMYRRKAARLADVNDSSPSVSKTRHLPHDAVGEKRSMGDDG